MIAFLAATAACGQRTQAPPPTPTAVPEMAAAPSPPPTQKEPDPLPRTVGDIALGMPRAAVEQRLGKLTCHENPNGFDVCGAAANAEAQRQKLEIFFFRGAVVSLAHELPTTGDVWSQLAPLLTRYGNPSLNGLRERDRDGRLHEVYGWKDKETLYSIRFVWKEESDRERQLVGTTVTLWDRQGYADWENDPNRKDQGTRPTPEVT